VILHHNATYKRSNERVAFHPLGVGHSWVDVEAVALDASLVPTVRCLDEQGELVTHQLRFNHAEGKGRGVVFFDVAFLIFALLYLIDIEAVTRILHHRELCIPQFADLVKLAERGGRDPVCVLFNASLHEFVGFFSIVAEWAADGCVAIVPVLLQLVLEESNLDRW
jgi:hypothetical protein